MQKPESSTYTPIDFVDWREAGCLVLTPKFQRRRVWTTPARSYLIDTLLQGMPVPPIYIRVVQDRRRERIIREVIDGQQRIAAVLDFVDGKYALSRSLDAPYSGKRMSDLSADNQSKILSYGFRCELFHGISDQEVLGIFARMNQYSVRLNAQELRNGKYFGPFKQTAYALAHEHLEFWRRHRIFSESRIARMAEVELTSELMIAQMAGLQDKKKSIDKFYQDYDETFSDREQVIARFRSTIDTIDRSLGDSLKQSQFRGVPLFYSLFCAVFHRTFGLPEQAVETPRKVLSIDEREGLAAAVAKLSDIIAVYKDKEDKTPTPEKYRDFVIACLRQTDNLRPRERRFHTIYQEAF